MLKSALLDTYVVVRRIVGYGDETWLLTRKSINEFNAVERNVLVTMLWLNRRQGVLENDVVHQYCKDKLL